MNYPQTHQYSEGKEETGQRRKAVLIGRVVKIEELARVGDRQESMLVGPQGALPKCQKIQALLTSSLPRPRMLPQRFCHSALNSPQLRREVGLAIIDKSWEMKRWDIKSLP